MKRLHRRSSRARVARSVLILVAAPALAGCSSSSDDERGGPGGRDAASDPSAAAAADPGAVDGLVSTDTVTDTATVTVSGRLADDDFHAFGHSCPTYGCCFSGSEHYWEYNAAFNCTTTVPFEECEPVCCTTGSGPVLTSRGLCEGAGDTVGCGEVACCRGYHQHRWQYLRAPVAGPGSCELPIAEGGLGGEPKDDALCDTVCCGGTGVKTRGQCEEEGKSSTTFPHSGTSCTSETPSLGVGKSDALLAFTAQAEGWLQVGKAVREGPGTLYAVTGDCFDGVVEACTGTRSGDYGLTIPMSAGETVHLVVDGWDEDDRRVGATLDLMFIDEIPNETCDDPAASCVGLSKTSGNARVNMSDVEVGDVLYFVVASDSVWEDGAHALKVYGQ